MAFDITTRPVHNDLIHQNLSEEQQTTNIQKNFYLLHVLKTLFF